MSTKRQKHFGDSWVVEANRERDRISVEEGRVKWEGFREEYRRRIQEDIDRDPGWQG